MRKKTTKMPLMKMRLSTVMRKREKVRKKRLYPRNRKRAKRRKKRSPLINT